MKKWNVLAAIFVFCLIAWGGTTYVVGDKAQAYYNFTLAQYGNWGPFTFTNQTYERGFLNSRAETLLQVQIPNIVNADGDEISIETLELLFEHTLHHGPMPLSVGQLVPALAVIDTKLVRLSSSEEELDKLLRDIPEFADTVALVTIGFNGDTAGHLQIPDFTRQKDETRLYWGGLTIDAEFSPPDKTLKGELAMPEFSIHSPEGHFTWQGLRGGFDLKEAFPLIFVGDSKMISGPMLMQFNDGVSGEQDALRLEDFEISSFSRAEGLMVDYDQRMSFKGLTFSGETYGPVLLEVEARNLDGQVLSDFQQQVYAVYRDSNRLSPDELTAELSPLYAGLFAKLLEGNPEFNIRHLQVSTPMGQANAVFLAKVSGYTKEPMETLSDPIQLLQHLVASAEITVDESLVRDVWARQIRAGLVEMGTTKSEAELQRMVEDQLESQLDSLVVQKFITRADGMIRSTGSFNRGQLIVNGQLIPLSNNN